MKLVHKNISCPIIDNTFMNLLIIENPVFFRKFHHDILKELNREEESLFLSINNKLVNFSQNSEFILSPWNISLNEKRLITKLHDSISMQIIESGFDLKLINLWNELEIELTNSILIEDSVCISSNDSSISSILKAFSVRFDDETTKDLIDLLMDLFIIKNQYDKKNLFILSQCVNFFTDDEIVHLFNFCNNEKIHILLIEHCLTDRCNRIKIPKVIIDQDDCVIV